MDYFSGHADQRGLLYYVNLNPANALKDLFLVHGESEQSLPLLEKIKSKGYKNINYPAPGSVFEI